MGQLANKPARKAETQTVDGANQASSLEQLSSVNSV